MKKSPRSAYLHIPFCHKRCFYCDFAIVPLLKSSEKTGINQTEIFESYLELLRREIDLINGGIPLSTIYIGGGTPSLLAPAQIYSLISHLKKVFGIQLGAEITLEVDPLSFDKRSLAGFIESGINRFSLGGQSFDDSTLREIGRSHSSSDLYEACSWVNEEFRAGKIKSWSLDLIQNLPRHNINFWESQLKKALKTEVPHLSIYDLSIEPGTLFELKKRKGELSLPDEDLSADINSLTSKMLNEAGFARYEISNYALPGHSSRHNRVYWGNAGWWGFGMSATSAPWGTRYSRPKTLDGYEKWVKDQELNGIDSSLISKFSQPICPEDQLIVGLRTREGVDLGAVFQEWGWDKKQIEKYESILMLRLNKYFKKGLITKKGRRISLTNPKGMDLSNQILVEVIIWWDSLPESAARLPSSREL